ncbi:MAG: hypothetical protein A3H72_01535 [Candidatus Doudnabacteria bacterium RIFCSPLOWO2_02_FULL_48_8]|uniref:Uncharacterized protein n=1 Tax=Candidatus Doudnabacteria bacterium RIFCSPHIGHO2_01_FULL_46_24 TaxID=1817825 RepID=A0A1F5NSY5_9BACT|nr:MAG: hypothetical protein A2720_04430 [Candidatus Doudnabacteria bacterium RIFCSPHIGHO2_01_FULL_46_24]OGE95296.1 MAG: hypothetical protein A3H72_01535 [Candidatus Doudnabacteria bacterium RIFCSPLOWO2_02_FULL_48_8]OGE96150.1 MAG: hypothetical protein A3E98_03535 [Candidatus Doudnabacteria bacterium RIFCSPHIGHO2_12_FULL_48_11]
MSQDIDPKNLGINPEEMLTDEIRESSLVSTRPSQTGELVSEEKAISYQERRELKFQEKIAISLEKLAGYEDSQLLAVYPEYAFNGQTTESGGPLEVLTVAEIREKIIQMRDPQKNFSGARPGIGAGPEQIIIVYDDLPPLTQTEDAKARWRDFYSRTREGKELFTPEGDRRYIERLKFEALNELRGLRDDRRIAIRSIYDEELHIIAVGELRELVLDMENPENKLTHGQAFDFWIEEYYEPEQYVQRERADLALRDIRQREHLLAELAEYSDDKLLTWVYPNESRNFSTGQHVIMQDLAGDLRKRINQADHDELDWFSHAGGIRVIAVGEVDLGLIEQKIRQAEQNFQVLLQQVIREANQRQVKPRKDSGIIDIIPVDRKSLPGDET